MNKRSYVVYRHTAPNGKMYVGITSKPPSYRWDSGRGYITNQHFIRAINKYGWNNIKHDILLENLTAEEASLAEEIFIHYWDLTNPNKGYNHETGGIKNFTVSDETSWCRFLTRREQEQAQTLPIGYCDHLSYNQACDVIGDGWTVDVIKHILNFIPKGDLV